MIDTDALADATGPEQPAKVHVDWELEPLWLGLDDLIAAYGQTTDYREARRLAWINVLARDNIRRLGRLNRGAF